MDDLIKLIKTKEYKRFRSEMALGLENMLLLFIGMINNAEWKKEQRGYVASIDESIIDSIIDAVGGVFTTSLLERTIKLLAKYGIIELLDDNYIYFELVDNYLKDKEETLSN